MVLFDDLHWAEPTFLDLVEYLARAPRPGTCDSALPRPATVRRAATGMAGAACRRAYSRTAERAGTSRRLIESLGTPVGLRARIAEAAEGNPLFVEQLAQLQPTLARAAEPGLEMMEVSSTIRLDHSNRGERSVLECAAVVGRTFKPDTVRELMAPEAAQQVQERLSSLVGRRFVRLDALALDESFRFEHALIRDAVYDAMPKSLRADLHVRMAARLDSQGEEDALVGFHLEQAFLLRHSLRQADAEARPAGRHSTACSGTGGDRPKRRASRRLAVRACEGARPTRRRRIARAAH